MKPLIEVSTQPLSQVGEAGFDHGANGSVSFKALHADLLHLAANLYFKPQVRTNTGSIRRPNSMTSVFYH